MRKIMLFVLTGWLLSSCTQDDCMTIDNSSSNSELMIQDESIPTVNSFQESYALCELEAMQLLKEPTGDSSFKGTLLPTTAIGYTRITKSKSVKAYFGTEFAKRVGLQPGVIYLYQWKFVEKDINTNGKTLFEEKSDKCGMQPSISGESEETDFNVRGYRIVESGNPTVLRTHLFYVESDIVGRRVNRYVPQTPEKIEWNYYLF